MMIKSAARSAAKLARPEAGPSLGFEYADEPIHTPNTLPQKAKKSPRCARLRVSYPCANRFAILVTHPSHRTGDVRPSRFAVAASAISDRVATGCNALLCKARRAFTVAKRIAGFPLRGRDSHAFAVATAGVFLPLNANHNSRVFV